MNSKKWREAYTAERAAGYNEFIKIGAGPVYRQLLDTIAETIELLFADKPLRILDLGAGTGNVSARILQSHADARITCLDGSPDMLARAREQFRNDPRVDFAQRDFSDPTWRKGLNPYHVAVSVGAIHHLDSRGKAGLFRQIFTQLLPQGLFLCADPLSGASAFFDQFYEDAWVRQIQRNFQEQRNVKMSLEEIRTEHRRIQRSEGDQPSPLEEQLRWLSAAGFHRVECHWKSFGFAVFGGMKP